MSVCRWCTPLGDSPAELLQKYCDGSLADDEEQAMEEDLSMCLECVDEYHRVRKESPQLHERLWKLEKNRLLSLFASVSKEGLEDHHEQQYDEEDDLYFVDVDGQQHKVPDAEYAHKVRIPLTEILKYRYLLGDPKISEMCVDALCKLEESQDSFRVYDKHPGTYLLLVHPNETVRRWAIQAAKSLGTVDRDDFYDLQDILSLMFLVIELGISEIFWDCDNPTAPWSALPKHLYDPNSPKDYWLGICMLLTQLDAQAMDSLFHDSDKNVNILQCIINTLKKSPDDEVMERNQDSFWPALQCFMVILECMGSMIWGQIDPRIVFHAVTESPCYNAEIQNIRRESSVKSEPVVDDDDDDDMVTCSQMVYECKKSNKEKSTRPSHSADDIVNYEEMMSLMKSDLGQAMRVHKSTFLWFIPFVKSIMGLHSLMKISDIIYVILEYICGEINGDLHDTLYRTCDRVTEFLTLILVHIIEQHLGKGQMDSLYYCNGKWLEIVVTSATLPRQASQGVSGLVSSTSSSRFAASGDVPQACMQLLRKLLKVVSQMSPDPRCSRFLNLINKQIREGTQKEWNLSLLERKDLRVCLKKYLDEMASSPVTLCLDPCNTRTTTPPQTCSNTSGPEALSVDQPEALHVDQPEVLRVDQPEALSVVQPEAKYSVKQEQFSCEEPSGSAQTDEPMQRKLHSPLEDDTDVTGDSRVTAELAPCRPNPGKMNALKSGLAQLMAQKKSDKKSLKQSSVKVESRIPRPSTSISDERKTQTSSSGTESDCADDDVPLSVLKTRLIKPELQSPVPVFEERASADVIVISDTDDETDLEDELEKEDLPERVKTKIEPCDVEIVDADFNHGYDGSVSESQVFEFETQEDVVSAWDNGLLEAEPAGTAREESPVRPAVDESSRDYCLATQPITNADIEEAFQQMDEQCGVQKELPEGLRRAPVVKKRNLLVEPKPLPTKPQGKKALSKEGQIKRAPIQTPESIMPPLVKVDPKPQPNRSENDAQPSTSTSWLSSPGTRTPAVVPPKKDRKAPELLSTAEKLGLKKKQRKAFDYSQRSLDSLDELRRYGQGVHIEQKKKSTRRSKKQMSSLPKMIAKGSKRKLLSSQQQQFYAQSRAKRTASGAGTSAHAAEDEDVVPNKHIPRRKASNDDGKPKPYQLVLEEEEEEDDDDDDDDDDVDTLPCSQLDPLQRECQTSLDGSSGNNSAVSRRTPSDDEDPEWWQCTQNEPTDMDLCSQMEDVDEDFQHTQHDPVDDPVDMDISDTQHDPVDMDISDSEMPLEGENEPLDWTSPVEANEKQGFMRIEPSTHANSAQGDDHLFLKPGMSPMTRKKAKPSTTKIYATSSSRSASLVEEMAKTADSAGRPRPTRAGVPVRKPGTPQPSMGVTQAPPPLQVQPLPMLPPKPPPPKQPPATEFKVPHTPRHLPTPVAKPVPPTYKIYARPEAPVVKHMPEGFPPRDAAIQLDPSTPVENILKWSYAHFQKYKNFGAPTEELCPFPLEKVGASFGSFDEYYKVFYPLLLLNTFEELVEDWLKNTAARRGMTTLTIVQHPNNNGVWHFKTILNAQDESRQQYPKEEELVILWLTQNNGEYSANDPESARPTPHFGFVQKPSIIYGDQGSGRTLKLQIKTRGNFTSVKNRPVRCEVVGSLVSILRQYNALCELKKSAMGRPIVTPYKFAFQAEQEQPPSCDFPGYNSAQSRAIRSGVAAVRNPKGAPKICVIHGPPGTGKSKTIVGLLQQLFTEGHNTKAPAPVNRPSSRRRMRVLLCAPSNAAIDCLMKKVILDLKERWDKKNKNNSSPPGNCGELHLVRLGNEKTMDVKIRLFSLDSITTKRTQKTKSLEPELQRRKAELEEQIMDVSTRCIIMPRTEPQYQELAQKKNRLCIERETLSNELKQCRSKRWEIQTKVLQEAHIICCTLSTSGSGLLASAFHRLGHEPFSCIVVDEAGQATENETLIPLMYHCNTLVLVGDPEQLPPIVKSQKARDLNYGQSLMARLCWCTKNADPNPIIFLRQQYRMHPDICDFPSKYIYKGALKTDPATAVNRCKVSWPFQSYRLFDVIDGCEIKEGESYSNEKEVKLLMVLLKLIFDMKQPVKVGVITPYNAQKDRIKREVIRGSGIDPRQVEVDTVDGFQGREMECIIVSCVRAGQEGGIGFLKSRQRLNVTITRATSSLFILGHLSTLRTDADWSALIQDAARRETIIRVKEEAFKQQAVKIFKPESRFSRSLSYPPHEPPFRQSVGAPAPPVPQRTIPIPPTHSHQPSPTSPPRTEERPTDPRLAARHRVPADTRQDPRGHPAARPQAGNTWADLARDWRGERNPPRGPAVDPRGIRDDSSHGSRTNDWERKRHRSSAGSGSRADDGELRDPRRPRYPSPSDARTQERSSHLPRAAEPRRSSPPRFERK